VVALGAQDADPEVRVPVEVRHRRRELSHHLRREGVLLGRIVDDDLQGVVVTLTADAPFRDGDPGHGLFAPILDDDCHAGE
jgi:hypothetical protein